MICRYISLSSVIFLGGIYWDADRVLGTHQICIGRSECYNPHFEWEIGNGNIAGNLVLGVSQESAYEESCCYDSGREVLKDVLLEFEAQCTYN